MLIPLAEAAQILGIPSRAKGKREGNRLWELLRYGKLGPDFPARKLGRRWMVDREGLTEWVRKKWRHR